MTRNTTYKSYCPSGKKELYKAITSLSFVIDELRLFLDTHPCDEEARMAYQNYKCIRNEYVERYAEEYGPIESYRVNAECEWSWVNEPLPWKGEI